MKKGLAVATIGCIAVNLWTTCSHKLTYPAIILIPTNANTRPSPVCKCLTLCKRSSSSTYKDRSPSTASMFDEYTRNLSCVNPKMHGMESIAKITSEASMTNKAANIGVATRAF